MATEPAPQGPQLAAILGQLVFVVVAALFVYGFVAVTKEGEMRRVCSAPCFLHPDYLGADRKAPDFTLKDMKGKPVHLESYRGKVVVLNFWTKTCGPCREELPDLAEMTQVLADRPDVVVLAVSTDDGPDDVRATLKTALKGEPPFQVLFDPESSIVKGRYGTHLFPETWFIDKRGVIRARFDGGRDWTNPLYVNFIDSLRSNDYCSVKIEGDSLAGRAGGICKEMTGT
jgi:peroxiredoxin